MYGNPCVRTEILASVQTVQFGEEVSSFSPKKKDFLGIHSNIIHEREQRAESRNPPHQHHHPKAKKKTM
jgi:hypothetical protein